MLFRSSRVEIQFAYAIGHPLPVSVHVDSFGTGTISDEKILAAVNKVFSFKPADIVKQLNLLRPIYSKSTNYGHFGKINDVLPKMGGAGVIGGNRANQLFHEYLVDQFHVRNSLPQAPGRPHRNGHESQSVPGTPAKGN